MHIMIQRTVLSLALALSFTLPSYAKPTILNFRHDQHVDTRDAKKVGFVKSIRNKMNGVANWISENQILSATIALLVAIPVGVAAWYGKKLFKKDATPVVTTPITPLNDRPFLDDNVYSDLVAHKAPDFDVTSPNDAVPAASNNGTTLDPIHKPEPEIGSRTSSIQGEEEKQIDGTAATHDKAQALYSNPEIEKLTLWDKAAQENTQGHAASTNVNVFNPEETTSVTAAESSRQEVAQVTITTVPTLGMSTSPHAESKSEVTVDISPTNDINPAAQPAEETKHAEETKADPNLHHDASSSMEMPYTPPRAHEKIETNDKTQETATKTPEVTFQPTVSLQDGSPLIKSSELDNAVVSAPIKTTNTPHASKRTNPYAEDDTMLGKGLAWFWSILNDENE